MNVSEVDLTALSHALDDSDPDREHFLDLQEGSLWTFVFSEASDEAQARHIEVQESTKQWLRVPSRTTQETYEEIEDFVETLPEGSVQDALFDALESRGALKNFRAALMEYPDIRQQWLAGARKRSRDRLDEFLSAEGWAPAEHEPSGTAP